jgi:hypothetical protein
MFSVGEVLKRSFEILLRNFAAFLLLSLLLSLPSLIYSWISLNNLIRYGQQDPVTVNIIKQVIDVFVSQLISATIIYGVVQELRGRRVSLMDSLKRGIGLLLPVVGVAILVGLATAAAIILPILPAFIVTDLLWVGIPAAIVLALMVMIRLWVSVAAAVVERPGVVASLRRSSELTRGRRWQIFGLLLIVAVLSLVIGYIVQRIFAPSDLSMGSLGTLVIVSYVVAAAFTAFSGVLVAVGYYYLRVEKEGVDIEKIAEAFD